MAHLYGTITGARPGQVTRCGTKTSGITTVAASWKGAVQVTIEHNPRTGEDIANVRLIPWRGHGVSRLLFRGLFGHFSHGFHTTPTLSC